MRPWSFFFFNTAFSLLEVMAEEDCDLLKLLTEGLRNELDRAKLEPFLLRSELLRDEGSPRIRDLKVGEQCSPESGGGTPREEGCAKPHGLQSAALPQSAKIHFFPEFACLGSEPATGQHCRLCCRLFGPLPTLNSAAKIREFYVKRPCRSFITNPKSVADSLPAHFPARFWFAMENPS